MSLSYSPPFRAEENLFCCNQTFIVRSPVLSKYLHQVVVANMPGEQDRRKSAEQLREKVQSFLPDTPFLETSSLRSLDNPILIDVRDPAESKEGTLPNSLNATEARQYLDSDRPIVCFCTVGLRSGAFARTLQAPGRIVYNYSVLEHLWAGENLVRTDGALWDSTVHTYSPRYAKLFPQSITVRTFSITKSFTKVIPALPSLAGAVAAWTGRKLTGPKESRNG